MTQVCEWYIMIALDEVHTPIYKLQNLELGVFKNENFDQKNTFLTIISIFSPLGGDTGDFIDSNESLDLKVLHLKNLNILYPFPL